MVAEFLSLELRAMSSEPELGSCGSLLTILVAQSRRRCKPYDLTTPKYTPKGGIQG